ncbi:enoyl-CoA hydratase [Pseudoalteromonas sp. J010]|uniref:polyketide synthase n=1 Tax=Pseudoalteromonas sp. J010 TaxID=998465 RepID=UPI000F652FE0|nr:polyketide synthase [Pseudoalteromonas sp. J010]RRS10440.1 enoyl-CoA hydratase [Pseudoalteromonas sp. J010]
MSEPAVAVSEVSSGVVQITMQDKVNKNTFSAALTDGLIDAFSQVGQNTEYKVVILTGFDNYFASGGTQEDLLYLSGGEGKFSDRDLYSLALNCPIPVIAAMQGHGIGGGFVLGMFADIVILSRESIYTTNFMKYGFTPGMGATFVLPKKLGFALAEEMMLSAKNYRGAELQQRGVPFRVMPRAEVMEYAYELASTLAEKPRYSLVTLKDHLVSELRAGLSQAIKSEVVMHDKTFNQPQVKERIAELFGR